jgi:hypothetical protein
VDAITTAKPIFEGMFITGAGITAGTTVTGITAIDMAAKTATITVSNSFSLSDGTVLTFTAPSFTIPIRNALQNVEPTITAPVYPTPLYKSLASSSYQPLLNLVGVNGTSKTADNTKDLVWSFAAGSTTVGDVETLALQSGSYNIYKLNKTTGYLWRSQIAGSGIDTMRVTLTDAGGASTFVDLSFDFRSGAFSDSFSTAFDI